ncbi:MAG: M20 family metallopeptidase [Candidatus Aminicenantaceae bacterium]
MIEELRKEVKAINGKLIEWRRDFHRHPEIAYQEHRTSSVIRKFLETLNIPVKPFAETGLRGILEGIPGGKTVALRADMDALPLKEEGEREYISENPEACHACAHDGHMAILMGVAQLLTKKKDKFKGKVVFLFQPSEERIPGGAKKMIEEGALKGVDAIFGLHLWQPLPSGTIGIVKGAMMAAPDQFSLRVIGKGGHGSMPQTTVDPILVASHLVVNLQSIVSRNVDPLKSAVVSLGTIEGGTINNIIPCEVTLSGTVRTFDPELRGFMEERVREIVERTCHTFGATSEFKYERGYPPLINDDAMADLVLDVANKTLGEESIKKIDPVMGGEDFAYFLQKVPGAFLFFGMGDGMEFPHHHPGFDLDERALPQAALFMTSLALEYLQS